MLVRGAEPMEKRQRRILFPAFPDSTAISFLVIYEPVTPAAVSRQERSDRVSEEASFHRHLHFALTPYSCIFPLPHEALP
ncbi:hypothetical protein AA192_23390 [Salmonella enterica subsp. enterica serovar Senftenberg]|uniref:Uncharacterized protein n=2 Tax=Enterobacterales TaxID=91347 RepID=A0A614AWI4_SALSE|nr:hypothetical protein [Salmonella enterica]ECW4162015.1 hypothetical protein [Salmonella enterica subsp. enterica serovar Senftenberg]ECW4374590.1 hypothetical protein [Salmonella enterica subsp. enterica serovar Senftenberg]